MWSETPESMIHAVVDDVRCLVDIIPEKCISISSSVLVSDPLVCVINLGMSLASCSSCCGENRTFVDTGFGTWTAVAAILL